MANDNGMETVAQDMTLQEEGFALVSLTEDQQRVMAKGFCCGRQAIESIRRASNVNGASCQCISPTEDSAHATGYHPADSISSMSRYNAHREGFVFSDGAMFGFPDENSGNGEFEVIMKEVEECLHNIANEALSAIERNLQLPTNWFQQNFHHRGDHSQWHLKRYVVGESIVPSATDTGEVENNQEPNTEKVILPQHTDPSLLSVVVLDQPGRNPGAMGLQYNKLIKAPGQENKRVWTELPYSGHAVATIFVGSVLSCITGGKCPAAKHRVVQLEDVSERMAATFFLRPSGRSLLQVPPSTALEGVTLKKKQLTFDAWSGRVSKNYMKRKENGKSIGGMEARSSSLT